uniref:Solute carrier organic anion transporter family member n=1 Tax=Ciona intestinalis TaxID=7719 RepID=H2XPR3_CIOIN
FKESSNKLKKGMVIWFSSFEKFVFNVFCAILFKHLYNVIYQTYATTIERRYGLSASMIGLIVAGSDIGHLISLIPSALAASIFPRPILISCGGLLMAFGGALCCLPHFLCGLYVPLTHTMTNITQNLLEGEKNTLYSPQVKTELVAEVEAIFLLSTLLMGFGAGPVVTLHFSYIDDFAAPTKSPLYIAAVQTCSIIGVMFSYGIAGIASKLYVDIGRLNSENIALRPGDVQWVGAWWLGFIISSCGSFVFSLPLMCFKDESDFDLVFDEETNLLQSSNLECEINTNFVSDVIHPLQHILTNPAVSISLLSTIGWHFQPLTNGTFVLKYLQQEFLMSVSSSSLTVANRGAIIWLPAILGIPLGGYLYSKQNWSDRKAAWFIAVLMILSSIYYPAGCPTKDVIGLTTVTMETDKCANSCLCDNLTFDPVCGSDERTYVTPCHAGCNTMNADNNMKEPNFESCKCVGLLSENYSQSNVTAAINGFCTNKCSPSQLHIFVINFILRVLLLCMTYVPYGVFIMRSVRQTDKAVVIALKEIMGKLLGEIPGSILAGKLFDSCCQFWSKEESGGCQLYDLDLLR